MDKNLKIGLLIFGALGIGVGVHLYQHRKPSILNAQPELQKGEDAIEPEVIQEEKKQPEANSNLEEGLLYINGLVSSIKNPIATAGEVAMYQNELRQTAMQLGKYADKNGYTLVQRKTGQYEYKKQ